MGPCGRLIFPLSVCFMFHHQEFLPILHVVYQHHLHKLQACFKAIILLEHALPYFTNKYKDVKTKNPLQKYLKNKKNS